MKNNDLLLYGGLAFAAYYLFIKPKTTPHPVVSTVTPVTPVATLPASNTTSTLLNSINNVIKQITTPAPSSVVTVQAPLTASGTTAIDTTLQSTAIPVNNDSLYMMFENGDYPGALAGFIQEEMHG